MLTQKQDEWGHLYHLPYCKRRNGVALSVVIDNIHDGERVGKAQCGEGPALGQPIDGVYLTILKMGSLAVKQSL